MVEYSNTSINLPTWMIEEIRSRREKGTSRSEWMREAAIARMNAEDNGDWERPDVNPPETDGPETPADD